METSHELSALAKLYYDPKLGLRGINALYRRSQDSRLGLTRTQVADWLKSQSTSQEFLHRPVRTHYPLRAYVPFGRIQIDLLNMSNQSTEQNKGYHFIFNAIDVFSRYAFAVPIKNKSEGECLRAWKTVVDQIVEINHFPPTRVDSDLESAFMSNSFSKYCREYNIIQHFLLTNSNLGLIENFNKLLRQYIEKYKTAYNKRNWSDVLPDLLHNYNSSYNRNLRSSPLQALNGQGHGGSSGITRYIDRRVSEASRFAYNRELIAVGDKVRVKLQKSTFEKKTRPIWSSSIHTVTSIDLHLYFVTGRVNGYLKSEIQKVGKVRKQNDYNNDEDVVEIVQDIIPDIREEEKEEKKERTTTRRVNVEGVDRGNRRDGLRERKPQSQVEDTRYGRVLW